MYALLAVSDGTTTENLPAFVEQNVNAHSYDDDGNLRYDGHWDYDYDAENRLVWAQNYGQAIAGGPFKAFHIIYDYLGRRVLVHHYEWNGSGWSGVKQERFMYEGWNLIAKLTDMALTQTYVWGKDLSGSIQGAGGVGGLLLANDDGESYLPAYDAMGNVHAMIKASDGSIAAAYEYDAFGRTIRQSGPYAESNPFRYSTKYTDDTGLVYYGLRYYHPSRGRFVNRDPIGEKGGLNLYAFTRNNAVNRWDYLGLEEIGLPPFGVNCDRTINDLEDEIEVIDSCEDGTYDVQYIPKPRPPVIDDDDLIGGPLPPNNPGPNDIINNPDPKPDDKEVNPNNEEHPDCAGLRQQLSNARSTRDRHVGYFQNGGQYASPASRNLSAQDIISIAGIGASAAATAQHQYLRGLPTQSVQQLGLGAERYSNAAYRARVAGRVAGSVGGVFVAVDVVAFGDALADGRGEDALFAGGNVAYGTAALFVTGPVG